MISPQITKAVESIRQDREHGARELALEALKTLRASASSTPPLELRRAAQALALARPMMAAIANAMATAWVALSERVNSLEPLDEIIQRLEESPRRMAEASRELLPAGTLMTYSYSSTVIEVLGRSRPHRAILERGPTPQ